MALINIQTNLKDLKYREFGVDAPLVTKDINNPPNRKGLSLEVGARTDDLTRFTKLLKTPQGVKFLSNQTALQTLEIGINNPNRSIGGKLLSGGWNTAKQVASTLAQIPVNGTGTHFVEAFAGKQGYVEGQQGHVISQKGGIVDVTKNFEIPNPAIDTTNSGLDINQSNSRILKKYFGRNAKVFNQKANSINPLSSYNDLVNNEMSSNGQFALVDARGGNEGFGSGSTEPYFKPKPGIISSDNFGFNSQQTFKDDKGNIQTGIFSDAITARLPVTASMLAVDFQGPNIPDQSKYYDDIINFNFKTITPRAFGEGPMVTGLFFRAFLDSFDDKYNSTWGGQKYIGRAEELYNYEGFKRDISFSFKVAAMSEGELEPMYQKLNALAGHLAPVYSDSKFMKGNFVTVTVGDYIVNQPGFISSVGFSWNTDYPMSTKANEDSRELFTILDVSVGFTPIHTFAPSYGEFVDGAFVNTKFIQNDGTAYKNQYNSNIETITLDEVEVTAGSNGSEGNGGNGNGGGSGY